jgi:hypothetical protein
MDNIKDYLNEDIFMVLNSFVNTVENKLKSNVYVGTILEHDKYDSSDDATLGKCRIMVYGVYDNIPTDKLPWALPDKSWVGSETGSFIVPPVGTLVRVTFEQDNIYQPIYTGKLLQSGKVSPLIEKNYPNNMLMWSTDAGSSLQHDRSTGEEIKTNVVGKYTPDEVKVSPIGDNSVSTASLTGGELNSEGSIVETINGDADSIADSFYNKTMTIDDIATNEINFNKSDGSLTYEHTIGDNTYFFELKDDVLEITTSKSSGKDIIRISKDGIELDSPTSINIKAPEINVDGTPGQINIVNGTVSSPAAGLPCAIPFCLFNGKKHDTTVM